MNFGSEITKGALAILAAAVIWGLQPIFYGFLLHVPASEIAAHRILWSFVFFAVLLTAQGRLNALSRAVMDPGQAGWTFAAAVLVSFNWFFFVYAIQIGQLTQSSIGYYIYPLVAVALGYALFREHLPRLQWMAVGLAGLGVVTLTYGLGTLPGISLSLALTFAFYGVVKKKVRASPMVSVTAEVALLTPLVLVWIATATPLTHSSGTWGLLMLSGPLTGLPLILFAYASQRVRLSTVGVVSYLNPTMQFLVAAWIFSEPVSVWHLIALLLIWSALALYSGVAIAQERARAVARVGTSGTN